MNAAPAAAAPRLTEPEFRALYRRLRGQVPWGPADRRGALNYLTQADVAAAAREVRQGRCVSLAAPIRGDVTPDNPDPARHEMTGTAVGAEPSGLSFATDRVAMNVHGDADSHIDALCHVMFDQARVGHRRRRAVRGPWDAASAHAGLHPSVMPLLAERQIAVLGSDGNTGSPINPIAIL